jgi:hypothetical protein
MTLWCCVCLEEIVTTQKIQSLDSNLNELNATHTMKHNLIISARSYSNIYYQILQVDCFRRVPLCFVKIYVLWQFVKCLSSFDKHVSSSSLKS